MKIRMPILIAALLAGTPPLFAQERAAPPERPQPLLLDRVPWREHGEPIERLERLRLERLRESLDLTEEQTKALRRQMDESRTAMRESFERHHAAIESLQESLKKEPPDQDALRRALADVEAARMRMDAVRDDQMAELARTLTLEQRAKFLLFNRHFDERLRELVEHRRGPASPGTQDRFRMPVVPPPGLEYRMPVVPPLPGPPLREERIEMLEQRIAEMEREIEELRAGD